MPRHPPRPPELPGASVLHMYVSTGCQHNRHRYCRATVREDGASKRPGECKFCGTPCLCPCHREETRDAGPTV